MLEVIDPIELQTSPAIDMDDEQFFQFCQQNSELRLERSSQGKILIMSPEGPTSGSGNARLARFFDEWAEIDGTGRVFGSSTGFTLPNGAVRSPDVSWVLNSRFKSLSRRELERFPRICPDFVLELRSRTDRLPTLQKKMEEYIANGARLGWLIDPKPKTIHIYRPNADLEILVNPAELKGDPVLPKFRLKLDRVWKVMEF
jgi:Uma2 family endonuclease